MKKGKITRLLLEIICGCLVLIAFSPFPAFAEDCDYTIYRADPGSLLVLDGRAGDSEPWAHVPWSTGFSQTGSAGVDGDHPAQAGFGAQFKALWQKDGVPISELSKETGLATTTLTSMLDRMEAANLIYRDRGDIDRRKILIFLTEEAKGLEQEYNEVTEEISNIYYKGFSEEEIEQLENYLHRILKNVEGVL